jgi:poly [ADP-ribose] polymerase
MAGIIEHRKFIAVEANADANHNKAWTYTVYDDNTVKYEWGRVGGPMATQTKPLVRSGLTFPLDMTVINNEIRFKLLKKTVSSSERDFLSKVYEKTHKPFPEPSYTEITIVGGEAESGKVSFNRPSNGNGGSSMAKEEVKRVAVKEIAGACPVTAELVKKLAEANRHELIKATGGIEQGGMDIDLATGIVRTAMGVVTLEAVQGARTILSQMEPFVRKNDTENPIYCGKPGEPGLLSRYLRLVPQATPRLRGWHKDFIDLAKQTSLLDQIETSIEIAEQRITDAVNAANKVTDKKVVAAPSTFECKLTLVSDNKLIERIKHKYLTTGTRGHQSSVLKPVRVYEVTIPHMIKAFDTDGHKVGNIKELWHGTRMFNVLSILKRGLVMPNALSTISTTGAMFGNGLYFSENSTKSLNYSYGYWDGGNKDKNCYMFLVDVAMGREYVPSGPGNGKQSGYDSCNAVPGRSGIMNHEAIVYRVSQANIRYLVEFS